MVGQYRLTKLPIISTSGRRPPMWQLRLGSHATGRETGKPSKRPPGITPWTTTAVHLRSLKRPYHRFSFAALWLPPVAIRLV
eukprot:s404_g31.t1